MLSEGPDVSFSGSPTVSPMTAALWQSEPLGPSSRACGVLPASMYFLALSHAPPVLDMDTASCTPDTRPPVSMPASACVPKSAPIRMGDNITSAPGAIISDSDDAVEISTQRL
eukprot:362807-Chlamydomonas_euryale.AAC.10